MEGICRMLEVKGLSMFSDSLEACKAAQLSHWAVDAAIWLFWR